VWKDKINVCTVNTKGHTFSNPFSTSPLQLTEYVQSHLQEPKQFPCACARGYRCCIRQNPIASPLRAAENDSCRFCLTVSRGLPFSALFPLAPDGCIPNLSDEHSHTYIERNCSRPHPLWSCCRGVRFVALPFIFLWAPGYRIRNSRLKHTLLWFNLWVALVDEIKCACFEVSTQSHIFCIQAWI